MSACISKTSTLRSLIDGVCGTVGVVGKNIKKISRDGWNRSGAGAGGVKLNFFFLSFFNHENYSIKNICECSKSKLKTKETNKQNLAYFKIINRILFFHRFCKNSKMLLPPSWAMFMERPATNLGGFARGERTP